MPQTGSLMAVVAQYQGPLLRYVGRMLGTIDDQREDVVQETFIRLHRQVSTQGWSSIQHLTTWLYRVAHNLTLDVLRQRVRRQDAGQIAADPAVIAEEHVAQEVDALGEAIRREARHVVLRELAQLEDEYRQVVLLKVVQGMSLRQVAEVVGVSLTTVNSRLNQGLDILAHRLRRAGVA
jgi:RNA polymerase sigma-70 factor (ECF subfamily)